MAATLKEENNTHSALFTLDGRNAGAHGQLTCRCRAPSGQLTYVMMTDNNDGTYTVDLNACEHGQHMVEIDWGGKPIPGSPFSVKIMQSPDERKVKAFGPGLISGVLETFRGIFHVDTKGGGPGALKVRVHGPRECFKVEMYRDHPKDRVINVRYDPSVPGVYTANVLWSNRHVNGSPFVVYVAKDADDLEIWKRRNRPKPVDLQERFV